MTRWKRVKAALAGREVDRVPVSFWGHDYAREWTAQTLAEATLDRYRRFGWDLIKVNPRSSYYAEAWGNRYQRPDEPVRSAANTEYVLKTGRELDQIAPRDVQDGPFGEQLEALRLIKQGLNDEAPFIQTVFSPLTVIGRLAGGDLGFVRRQMRERAESLHHALSAVAETLAAYAAACLKAGAAGIFLATVDWGTYDSATEEQYAEFGRPYDLQVLKAVKRADFNVLHVCRRNSMVKSLLDYPVHALNWAPELSGNPGFQDVLAAGNKAIIGGVSVRTAADGAPEDVAAEARQALAETGGRRFLLAPGCSVPPETPEANLRAALDAAEEARR
jgi:uroporphyrinogen decarboxylase